MVTKGRSKKRQKLDCKENMGMDVSLLVWAWVWQEVSDES